MNLENNTIQGLFDGISGGYDRFNRLSSLGLDKYWRRKALKDLKPGSKVLDIGTGTGDLALMAAERLLGQGEVCGIDFSEEMLKIARNKALRKGAGRRISWVKGRVQDLPFDEKRYDVAVSAFVLRNIKPVMGPALLGVHRSLKDGGRIAFVDITRPKNAVLRELFFGYAKWIMGPAGRWLFRNKGPADYLETSVRDFFSPGEFEDMLRSHGFSRVGSSSFFGGAITLFSGEKS